MLELGDSRQAFPDNGRKQKAKELFEMLNGVWQDYDMLNEDTQISLPLPRPPIFKVTCLCSS